MRRRLCLLAALPLVASCSWRTVRVGAPLPDARALEVGVTTREDALLALGPPRLIRRQFDGELYTWRYVESKTKTLDIIPYPISVFFYSDGEMREDDLTLMFGTDGVLRAVGIRHEVDADD